VLLVGRRLSPRDYQGLSSWLALEPVPFHLNGPVEPWGFFYKSKIHFRVGSMRWDQPMQLPPFPTINHNLSLDQGGREPQFVCPNTEEPGEQGVKGEVKKDLMSD
jgi:hypothetical protein